MKYFSNVSSLEELKKEYRRLALKFHPDMGGDTETMKEINNEHDKLFEMLKHDQNTRAAADSTGKTRKTTETPEEFRDIVDFLIHLNLDAELCGSWIWVGGDTKPHKEELKAHGFRWSQNKKKWYWRHPEDGGRRWHKRGGYTMEEIRAFHGSEFLTSTKREAVHA